MTTPNQPSIEELEQQAHAANEALRKAREAEYEKRTLTAFRDDVKEHEQRHSDLIDRQTSYDTDSKARLFGFGAFTGRDGSLAWILAGSIFAVEKDPNEDFTIIKTASEPIGVKESPDGVFNELTRIRFEGSAESVREHQAELARREERAKEAETAVSAPDTPPTNIPTGPNFAAVSAAAGGRCADCGADRTVDRVETLAEDYNGLLHTSVWCDAYVSDEGVF